MSRQTVWAAIAVAAVAIVIGASLLAIRSITAPEEMPPADAIAIPTVPRPPGEGCRLALLTGTVAVHPDWGIAVDGGNAPVFVFWPHGWSARRTDGGAELLDQHGRVVARTGDEIRSAGGLARFGGREGFAVCASDVQFEPAAP